MLSKAALVVATLAATADAKLLRSNQASRVATGAAVCPYPDLHVGDPCPVEFYPESKWHCTDSKVDDRMKKGCDAKYEQTCSTTGSRMYPTNGDQVNSCINEGCATEAGCTVPVAAAPDPEAETPAPPAAPVICAEGEVKLADGTCKHQDDVEFTEGGGVCSGSVQLFKNGDLTGVFAAGDGKFAKGDWDFPQFKLKVDNDATSSLEVPQGCMAILFQHENFQGDFAVFTPGTYTQEQMEKKGISNNDASSIKVQDLSAAGCHRKAKLFEHGWFDGTEHKFKKGEYNRAAFAEKAKDNDVSSLKVPVGCKVTLYEDEFSGKTAVFPPGNYDVDQMKAGGMDNDMVSSMKVENEVEIDEVAKEGLARLGLPGAPTAAAPAAPAESVPAAPEDMCKCTGNINEIECSITGKRHCSTNQDCTGTVPLKFGNWGMCTPK